MTEASTQQPAPVGTDKSEREAVPDDAVDILPVDENAANTQPSDPQNAGAAEIGTVSAANGKKPFLAEASAAAKSVPNGEKKRAAFLLGAAGVTIAIVALSRLIWLLEPLFDKVYYGTLSEIIYYIALVVLFAGYTVGLHYAVKGVTGERLFVPRKPHMDVKRTLGVIALAAAVVFFVSAGFKFKIKLQVEMGSGVTMARALTNIAVYLYYGLHLWLGLTAAELIRRGMNILVPASRAIPWGEIALVTLFGLTEFAFEAGTTAHLYPWLYYIFTYVYAGVYALTDHSYHLTFWACVAIMVL